jgi:hypothetical protein
MTDKANASPRAEQAAESAAKNASQCEPSALQDFVAGLLPKTTSRDAQGSGSSEGESSSHKQQQVPRDHGKDNGDIIGKIGDRISDGMKKTRLDDIQIVGSNEKGVIKLQTGDTLVRAGGMEVLVTKGGGSIMVKPDGSYEVTGGTVKHDAKTGETTVDFGNGRTATIRDGKIDSVSDGKTSVWMVNKTNRLDDSIKPVPFPHPNPGEWERTKPETSKPNISNEQLQELLNGSRLKKLEK